MAGRSIEEVHALTYTDRVYTYKYTYTRPYIPAALPLCTYRYWGSRIASSLGWAVILYVRARCNPLRIL
jgi:hypothetical protein